MRRRHFRHARGKVSREKLLADALRDWRSGRAYFKKGRYWIRPIVEVGGAPSIGWRGQGRVRVAPWSKAALEEWGGDDPSFTTTGLYNAANAKYGEERSSALSNRLLEETVREEGYK